MDKVHVVMWINLRNITLNWIILSKLSYICMLPGFVHYKHFSKASGIIDL